MSDEQQQALFRQWITSPAAGYVRQNLDGTPCHHPQPTLTDAERTAIEAVIEDYEQDGEPASAGRVATLRGLLERLGGDR